MTSNLFRSTAIILAALCFSAPAYSGDIEHMIVEKVIDGYGGDKFENLTSLTLKNDLRFEWLGQGYSPEFVGLDAMRKIYNFDFVSGLGSEEAWGASGGYIERVFTTDSGQYTIDYNNKTYAHDPEADLYSHFGGEMRSSDTLLAHQLMKHRQSAKYLGLKNFRGTPHQLIEFDMPGTSIEPELWVNTHTGLISRMRRDIPDVFIMNYVFNDFKQSKGISYADDFELYIDNQLVEYAKSRELIPNRVKSHTFEMDKGIIPEPERLNTDEMSVDRVSDIVHLVGQGGAFGAFVDAGDHMIGIGGYGGLADRFKAYQTDQGHSKPLKYLLLTHHHRDHLEGAVEALELGAQLFVTEGSKVNLRDVTGQDLPGGRLRVLTDAVTSIGPVEVHLISTAHVEEFALAYIPAAKTAFQADHYSPAFKNRASYVSPSAMSLKSEIDRLGLDVENLLSAHGRKIENWSEFLSMADQYVPGKCPTGREICRDLK